MLEVIQVTTTGSAGSASGNTVDGFLVHGYLMGVKVAYHASAPATTDVTITENNGLGRTILTLTDNNTTTVYNPQNLVNKTDGTSAAVYWPFYLDGVNLKVAVAGCDALTNAVVVTFSIAKDLR